MMTMMVDVIKLYINLIERVFELLEKKKSRRRISRSTFNETINKVETAQNNLADAVEAIEIIKEEVISEKAKLDDLLKDVQRKRNEHERTSSELKTAQELLEKDQEKLKVALGINTTRDRILGFVGGVVASIVATALWILGSNLSFWLK